MKKFLLLILLCCIPCVYGFDGPWKVSPPSQLDASDGDPTGAVTVDADGAVTFNYDATFVDSATLKFGTGADGQISTSSDNVTIENVTSNKDIIFEVNDDGVANTEVMRIDASNGSVGIGAVTDINLYDFEVHSTDRGIMATTNNTARQAITATNTAGGSNGIIRIGTTAGAVDNVYYLYCVRSADADGFGASDEASVSIEASGRTVLGVAGAKQTQDGAATWTPSLQTHREGANGGLGIFEYSTTNTHPASLFLNKSATDSVGVNSGVPDDNEETGQIVFTGGSGTGFEASAKISARIDGTAGNNDMPGELVFFTTADGADVPTERMSIDAAGVVINKGATVNTPSGDQSIAAGTGITTAVGTSTIIRVVGDGGAVTVTATPSIQDGAYDGQIIIIQGTNDTNTVLLQDESALGSSGLQLSGGNSFTMGQGDILQLTYDSGDDKWYEISRSDN